MRLRGFQPNFADITDNNAFFGFTSFRGEG